VTKTARWLGPRSLTSPRRYRLCQRPEGRLGKFADFGPTLSAGWGKAKHGGIGRATRLLGRLTPGSPGDCSLPAPSALRPDGDDSTAHHRPERSERAARPERRWSGSRRP
jgi:hypothetical protein